MRGQITVRISPDGQTIQTEVNGIKGSSCESLTEALEKAMGQTVKSDHTEEYYQVEQEVVHIK